LVNAADPVLQSVPAERRPTRLAERVTTPSGIIYRFDFPKHSARDTKFFDV
jgi:protocatechuate 3,4-dioxygenase, alpha subunit